MHRSMYFKNKPKLMHMLMETDKNTVLIHTFILYSLFIVGLFIQSLNKYLLKAYPIRHYSSTNVPPGGRSLVGRHMFIIKSIPKAKWVNKEMSRKNVREYVRQALRKSLCGKWNLSRSCRVIIEQKQQEPGLGQMLQLQCIDSEKATHESDHRFLF